MDNKLFGDDSNDIALGIELCYFTDYNRSIEAYNRYVWVIAYLAYYHGMDMGNFLVGHSKLDPGRKTDPENGLRFCGKTYQQFYEDVLNEYVECTTPQYDLVLIYHNDKKICSGYLINGITYAPLRFLAEYFGKTVGWDGRKKIPLLDNVQIYDFMLFGNTTYCKIRQICEYVNCEIIWNGDEKSITLVEKR
jgi:hypothetical protein